MQEKVKVRWNSMQKNICQILQKIQNLLFTVKSVFCPPQFKME